MNLGVEERQLDTKQWTEKVGTMTCSKHVKVGSDLIRSSRVWVKLQFSSIRVRVELQVDPNPTEQSLNLSSRNRSNTAQVSLKFSSTQVRVELQFNSTRLRLELRFNPNLVEPNLSSIPNPKVRFNQLQHQLQPADDSIQTSLGLGEGHEVSLKNQLLQSEPYSDWRGLAHQPDGTKGLALAKEGSPNVVRALPSIYILKSHQPPNA